MASKIKVIDSIMGQGKTTWAIQYMKDNPDKRFIYVTPFLDEVERIRAEIPSFVTPKKIGGKKINHIKELVNYGKNIATTHQLMGRFDEEIKQNLELGEYVLILDEVLDVVEHYTPMTKADVKNFIPQFATVDEQGYLVWDEVRNPPEAYGNSRFAREMDLCLNKNLIYLNGDVVYKEVPAEMFTGFKEMYILTYLFSGSLQKAYFDIHNLEYEYLSVKDGKLVPYKPTPKSVKQEIRSLIYLVEKEKLNLIGKGENTLSSGWLSRNIKKGTLPQIRLKLDTENFFKNIAQTKSEQNMWTTLLPYKPTLRGIGYGKESINFVPFNIKATNKHQDKRALAFLCNIFPHQSLKVYFSVKGDSSKINIDSDIYALSSLVQWVWRSSIRRQDLEKSEREIHLYLPSERMRKLLLNWLNSDLG